MEVLVAGSCRAFGSGRYLSECVVQSEFVQIHLHYEKHFSQLVPFIHLTTELGASWQTFKNNDHVVDVTKPAHVIAKTLKVELPSLTIPAKRIPCRGIEPRAQAIFFQFSRLKVQIEVQMMRMNERLECYLYTNMDGCY